MALKCKCPECGHEFVRPPFDRKKYQADLMKERRKKNKKSKNSL